MLVDTFARLSLVVFLLVWDKNVKLFITGTQLRIKGMLNTITLSATCLILIL